VESAFLALGEQEVSSMSMEEVGVSFKPLEELEEQSFH
jgi:hypothetical protein